MKNNLGIAVLFLSILSVILSCSKDSEQLKIGMFVVGDGYNDSGYKQNCKEGLLQACNENNSDTLFVSSLTHSQEEIDYFPNNGYDALFLAGSLASDQLLASAQKYPQTQFIVIDYNYEGSLPNVQSIFYNIDEAAFPLGFFAAYWAYLKDNSTPAVGIIGGMDIPAIQRFTKAYHLGVSYFNNKYNRDVKVCESFLNSFDNSDYGYKVADSLINNHSADVILPVAGAAGNGALYATKANSKWAIGVDADQYYSLPDISGILLSSCTKNLKTTIYAVATSFINNPAISNSTYTGTLGNQGVSLAPFHNFDSQIPDSIKQTIETIKSGIIAGTIDTGF
jgi:basic membrane protein A and related proteins